MRTSKILFIGLDYDGTVVDRKNEPNDNCLEVLEKIQGTGHKIILHTMRSAERLVEAVEYLEENGIKLYAVNENPTQKHWTASPKIFCNIYIDDSALGIPLVDANAPFPLVDWYEVEKLLTERGVI